MREPAVQPPVVDVEFTVVDDPAWSGPTVRQKPPKVPMLREDFTFAGQMFAVVFVSWVFAVLFGR